jgi:hypothetical protein
VPATRVFALSAHASYECRHSGACCTAGWSIPVEPHARTVLQVDWLAPQPDGACPQYDRSAARCRVHRDHGEDVLPRSCHHFPRRALVDDRGCFVTLSHFCPTAASLLVDADDPLRVIEGPPGFREDRGYDGLTACGDWPPLLTSHVLFDRESYSEWERHLVDRISSAPGDVETVLHRVADDAERLRVWNASEGSLLNWTRAVIEGTAPDVAHDNYERYEPYTHAAAYAFVSGCVPDGLPAPALPDDFAAVDRLLVEPHWQRHSRIVKRYVATKGFGSWTAYQWRDVRTQVAELFASATILRVECARAAQRLQRPLDREILVEAVRASDLLLVHLADRDLMVDWLRKAER